MPAVPPTLDHLVYAVGDLAAGVAAFAERTGVEPVRGGQHLGFGTANHLVGLGPGRYLEIIGPDPAQPHPPSGRRLFGVAAGREPVLLTWAVATADITAQIDAARRAGYDPGPGAPLSRPTRDGGVLAWRLTPDTADRYGGTVPFLIDWQDSEHPSRGALPQLALQAFTVLTPRPAQTTSVLAALGTRADVRSGPAPALRAVLDTPRGPVELR